MIVMNLCQSLNHLSEILQEEITERGLTFSFRIGVGTPHEIKAHRDDILQTLLLLACNAIKFTTAGGIEIFVNQEGSGDDDKANLRFAVSDTGCGMGQPMHTRLNSLFYNSTEGAAEQASEFGRGELSLVKRFVDRMGGSIGFTSTEGQGSSFWFITPCELLRGIGHAECELTDKLKVLVVDDNQTNIAITARVLENSGHSVAAVESGFSALQILAERDFDLIFMDLQMPEQDGYETTMCIRRGENGIRDPEIPIIALTALDMGDCLYQGIAAGMNDLLTKPIDQTDLKRILGETRGGEINRPRGWQYQPVLDQSDLLRRIGGDQELMVELLQVFLEDLPTQLDDLEKALATGDNSLLVRKAHSIKGASANVGAYAISVIAKLMEKIGRDGESEQVAVLLPRLKWEQARLIREL